jgi:hypothetical protein
MLDDLRGPLSNRRDGYVAGGSCNTRTQVEQLHFKLGVEEKGRINNVQRGCEDGWLTVKGEEGYSRFRA